jgi:hypothetical protein
MFANCSWTIFVKLDPANSQNCLTVMYRICTVPYRIVRYVTCTVPYRTLRYGTVANLICRSGFFALASNLFYRFRTVFRLRDGKVTLYESCVRLISSFDLPCVRARVRACARPICGRVSGYRGPFTYVSTRIRDYPPNFFQNSNTGLVRIIDRRSCRNYRKYGTSTST